MGEYADMMLDGTCCVSCGGFLFDLPYGEPCGFAVQCPACAEDDVRPPKPHKLSPDCMECNGWGKPVGGNVIYPHRPDLAKKRFWLCGCGAYVGSHANSGKPLGTCAGPFLRKARGRAHAAFDPLWRNTSWSRKAAYAWLSEVTGLSKRDCHMARMNAVECGWVIDACRQRAARKPQRT